MDRRTTPPVCPCGRDCNEARTDSNRFRSGGGGGRERDSPCARGVTTFFPRGAAVAAAFAEVRRVETVPGSGVDGKEQRQIVAEEGMEDDGDDWID